MQEYNLYNGKVKILFNENTHRYYLANGEKKEPLVGVTSYINLDKSMFLIPWAVGVTVDYIRNRVNDLEELRQRDAKIIFQEAKQAANRAKNEAGDIGTQVHKWVEEYILGQSPEMPEDERVLVGVTNFLDWLQTEKVEIQEAERIVYSAKHGYVGTLDSIATINKKRYLVDIKTGNGVYPEAMIQTAAYAKAYEEETKRKIHGRIVLRINKETEEEHHDNERKGEYKAFEAIPLDDEENMIEDDFQAFLSCKHLYEWNKKATKKLKELR